METSSGLARNGSIVTGRFCFCACYTSRHREVTMKSKRKFSVVIERDEEGYYVASVPALPGCHSQARSLDELMDRVREAIALCLEVEAKEAGGLEFVGVQRVSVPS